MFILKADCIVYLCIYININCICNNNIRNQQLLALTMRLWWWNPAQNTNFICCN